MSFRVRPVVGAVVLVVLGAVGCGSGDAPPAPPAAPVVPAPTIAAPTPAPTPTSPGPAAPTDAPAAAAPPIAPPILGGDLMWLDAPQDPERPTLLLRLPDRPRPAGPPIAWAQIHHGVMDVRLFGVVSSPYATAEVFGHEGTCTARVVGARELHTVARPDGDDDPASQRERTYLGLDLDGCERGGAGIVGTTTVTVLSVHELAEARGQPAPPELVAVVQEHDDDLGYAPPLAPGEFRTFALPERDLRIVLGSGAWVLTQGMRAIDPGGSNGRVDMVIEAGWRTFLLVSTPSEGWLESLESAVPEIHRSRCVVADASGTPLNVRRLPRSAAEVVATLANDTTLDALVGPGEWARVATTPAGWAHTSGLRCTAVPEDSWL